MIRSIPDPAHPDAPLTDHGLSADALLDLYRGMVEVRRLDEVGMNLQRQGQLGVWASCLGQEAAQVGSAAALEPQDWVFPSYREAAVGVMRGIPMADLMGQYKGVWLGTYDPYEYRFAMNSIPIATQAVHATGLAMAAQRSGDPVVAVAYMGDGATSEGDAHEAFNFAAVFGAPVVFFVQNNQWAISVPLAKQTAAETLAARAQALGFSGVYVDGNDVAAVHRVTADALARARAGEGPTLIEAVTYRMESHTTADDHTRYRSAEEVEHWKGRDPIRRLDAHLTDTGILNDELRAAAHERAEALASDARRDLLAMPLGDPLELFDHVQHNPPPHLADQREQLAAELRAWEDAE